MYKYLIPIALLTITAVYFASETQTASLTEGTNTEIYKRFISWKAKFNKSYNNDSDDQYRFNVFKANYQYIEQFNASNKNTVLGTNILADLTNEEYQMKLLSNRPQIAGSFEKFETGANFKAKDSVNWVKQGGVAPVQNQGSCGSCWAFGTVGGLEGAQYVSTGELVKLSEQQLVDCNTGLNNGCEGGLEIFAYNYTKNKGIMSGASYPYTSGDTGKEGECVYNSSDVVFQNTGGFQVEENNPAAMVEAITKQTLSKGISAGSLVFQLYSSGVLQSQTCGNQMNHSVTLVGYSDAEETPYWTIKNSWGTGWGNKGYMNIIKSMETGVDGVCGINLDSTGPTF